MRIYIPVLLLLCACAPEEYLYGAPPGECLKLTLQNNGFSTMRPARVSLFFTVDTCAGAPVARLSSDTFQLYEDGVRVSQFESQQRIQPRGERMRIFSVLLLDLSGSVLRSGEFPRLRDAASAFIDEVFAQDPEAHRVAIYTFDGRTELVPVVGFSADPAVLKAGLATLDVVECSTSAQCAAYPDRRTCAGWRCVDDSTNLYGAVVQGLATVKNTLATTPDIPHRQGTLVVFTDGTDQAARVSETAAVRAVQDSEVSVFTVGMGGEVDRDALRSLGKDGFYPVERSEDLSMVFGQVAARLTAMSQRYYLLEYCSPKRSGLHKLRVEATVPRDPDPPLTGSLSTEFDANGFESGCVIQ